MFFEFKIKQHSLKKGLPKMEENGARMLYCRKILKNRTTHLRQGEECWLLTLLTVVVTLCLAHVEFVCIVGIP